MIDNNKLQGTNTAEALPLSPDEIFITERIIADGETKYAIVYDKDDFAATQFATDVSVLLETVFGVKVDCKASDVNQPLGEYEIVISEARKGVDDVKESLKEVNDFAVKLKEKNLILYATGHSAYAYMLEYLKREVFVPSTLGDCLTVTSDDDIVYSQSELNSVTYPEYWREKNTGDFSIATLRAMFEPRVYEYKTDVTMPYRLYVPMNYDSAKKHPVLLYLHGAGERGNDNFIQFTNLLGTAFGQADNPFKDAIVIAPQCPEGNQWVNTPWAFGDYRVDDVMESNEITMALKIFELVTEEFSCDEKRYYVTGISMGGFGTWNILMRHGEKFAGAVPICGGADSTKGAVVKDIPIWTVHSIDDPVVPVSGTQKMVQAIKDAGGTKIIYTELDGHGHGVWNYTVNSKEIYQWLFKQTK